MSWIHIPFPDEEHELGAIAIASQDNTLFNEVITDVVTDTQTDDFEAEYDQRFYQYYIVSCSGC